MKINFGKLISMMALSLLLIAACDKPGVNSAIDQNAASDEGAAKGSGLKGLDVDHIIGKWEALEINNALAAKELTISDDSTPEMAPSPESPPTGDVPAEVPADVSQPSNSQVKSVKSTTCLNYPAWCPTLCKQWAYAEGCQTFINKCKTQPHTQVCHAYLSKLNQASGGSSEPVMHPVAVLPMNLKMHIKKSDSPEESDFTPYVVGNDTTNNMIQIRLDAPLQREDYYLMREVDGVKYLDICPCDAKECTANNAKTCSAEFLKKIEAGKPGQFKKL